MRASHKVPTHMRIPDKVVFGLTARQLLILLIGCSAGYDLWLQLHVLNPYTAVGLLVRLFITVVPVAVALVLALFSVAGRPLEVWLCMSGAAFAPGNWKSTAPCVPLRVIKQI